MTDIARIGPRGDNRTARQVLMEVLAMLDDHPDMKLMCVFDVDASETRTHSFVWSGGQTGSLPTTERLGMLTYAAHLTAERA